MRDTPTQISAREPEGGPMLRGGSLGSALKSLGKRGCAHRMESRGAPTAYRKRAAEALGLAQAERKRRSRVERRQITVIMDRLLGL